jgi:translocation protein SEC63
MATDYNYDEQGQFFPFFILTIAALITLPLTYSLLKPSKELENTAPRIKSEYKPVDEDLIQGQKRKQWRRERRLKRIITVIVGYATIAWMIYLIIVTARTVPQIWDPYNILGISRVRKIINGLVFAFLNIF